MRGASERLVPILMTAIVTTLGLSPLVIRAGDAGREIGGPMAIVILGGLLTSIALNLLVLATLALRYGNFKNQAILSQPVKTIHPYLRNGATKNRMELLKILSFIPVF